MPTNWPPTGIPVWTDNGWLTPPRNADQLEYYVRWHCYGEPWFRWRRPKPSEQGWFTGVLCEHGHPINGIIIISPDGLTEWPAGFCNTPHVPGVPRSRAIFVPYEPWYWESN